MQVSEGLQIINDGWIRKPKGFRVKCEQLVDGRKLTAISPPEDAAPLDSDVTAWRYARKLFWATRSKDPEIQEGELINIHVIDDQGQAVKFYATGEYDILNRK